MSWRCVEHIALSNLLVVHRSAAVYFIADFPTVRRPVTYHNFLTTFRFQFADAGGDAIRVTRHSPTITLLLWCGECRRVTSALRALDAARLVVGAFSTSVASAMLSISCSCQVRFESSGTTAPTALHTLLFTLTLDKRGGGRSCRAYHMCSNHTAIYTQAVL